MAIIKRKINWRNFWICFSISLGQVAFGYPSSIIGTTLGQPAFLLYMGLIDDKGVETPNANNLIGATSGVFQVRRCFHYSQAQSDISFQGRRFLRHHIRKSSNGQMGPQRRCDLLCNALHLWRRHALREPKHRDVHRLPLFRRSRKLGISRLK